MASSTSRSPHRSVELAALAAQARIVHVIGTTGLSAEDHEKIAAAANHAAIVQSGNMSLGINLLASLVEKVAQALGPEFDIEIVEMHHRMKVDAPSGTALLLGEAAARGRGVSLAEQSVRSRDGHTGARTEGAIGFATLRGGTVVGDHSVIFAGPGERLELSPQGRGSNHFRARRVARGALGARAQARPLFDGRRARLEIGMSMQRLLVLVRHGQSEWNLKNLFTGWKDPGLTELGVAEARGAGRRAEGGGFGLR